jgi:hypothetical protein
MLDLLVLAERRGWIDSAEAFVSARKLRNNLIHECSEDPSIFLNSLESAKRATTMLQAIVNSMAALATRIGLPSAASLKP